MKRVIQGYFCKKIFSDDQNLGSLNTGVIMLHKLPLKLYYEIDIFHPLHTMYSYMILHMPIRATEFSPGI